MATETDVNGGQWARWLSLILGVWLFISAFVWPHTAAAQTNTWILGLLIVAAAIWAMFMPQARYLNTVFAIWLFFSSFFIYHTNVGTVWNNVIVAIIVFIASLIPSGASTLTMGGPRRAAHA